MLSRFCRTRYWCHVRAIAQPTCASRALEQQNIGFSVRSSHAEVVDPAVSGHDDVEPVGIRCVGDVHSADLEARKTVGGALDEDISCCDGLPPPPTRRSMESRDTGRAEQPRTTLVARDYTAIPVQREQTRRGVIDG